VVALTQEDAVGTQSGVHETRVFDEDTLEAQDLIERERIPAGLQHGAPQRSSRVRGARSPSISKLARLSASSKKLAARETRCAPMRPTVARAFAARSSPMNSVSAGVRRMIGQKRPVPSRLSRRRWRFDKRGVP